MEIDNTMTAFLYMCQSFGKKCNLDFDPQAGYRIAVDGKTFLHKDGTEVAYPDVHSCAVAGLQLLVPAVLPEQKIE